MNRRDFFSATAGAVIVAPVVGMTQARFPDEIVLLIDEDGLVTEMLDVRALKEEAFRRYAHEFGLPK